jgi:hypothetical protein
MCSTAVGDALTALEAALDAVAADEEAVGDEARLNRVRRLAAARNRLDAQLISAVRQAESQQSAEHDGLKTMRSWLRTHTRISDRSAKQLIDAGRALESLPATEAAFVAGTIGTEQVAAITPVVSTKRLEQAAALGVDVSAIETELVYIASQLSVQRLRAAVHFYTERLDPDGVEPDPTEGRQLSMSRLLEGRWHGTFDLDAIGGEKLATALEAIAAASRCKGDTRTAAQTRGDALVQLADLYLASGQLPILRTVKPHVIVTIPVEDLTDPATNPGAARTGMNGRISAAKARWLACDSRISRMLIDADGLPLDVGREERVYPPHLRRAVVERDRECVFTGCEAPPWFCDVHHVEEWLADNGETSLDNAGLLCERHHTTVHHGYRVERDDGAPPEHRWRTYRPDGTEIHVLPPLLAA